MRLSRLKLLIAIFLLPWLSVQADQMIPMPIESMSGQAQLIVHGKVLSTTVQRDPEGRIYTAVDLQVIEVWKGTVATNRFTLVHGGGILGEEIAVVSGEAQYEVGEEVVSFMVLNQRGQGVSLGLSQGKFHVWKDPVTGETLAHNRFHGLHPSAANPATTGGMRTMILNRLTLAELKQRAAGGAK